jgi:hypothetical protein
MNTQKGGGSERKLPMCVGGKISMWRSVLLALSRLVQTEKVLSVPQLWGWCGYAKITIAAVEKAEGEMWQLQRQGEN